MYETIIKVMGLRKSYTVLYFLYPRVDNTNLVFFLYVLFQDKTLYVVLNIYFSINPDLLTPLFYVLQSSCHNTLVKTYVTLNRPIF